MKFILPIAAILAVAPWFGMGNYPLHLLIMTLLWAFVYTGWAVMGRLGMVSLGHGAFMGIGAYVVVLAWNQWGVTPWLGIALALALAALLAFVIGYPCFRFKIVGHYFALVTLALSEVVRLVIVALRDQTGGSLGATPRTAGGEGSFLALQFPSKLAWFYIVLACWLAGLWIWTRVDRSMARLALQAISEEEDAAASVGMNVTRLKLSVTMVSALMTCMGGVLYAQYQQYVNPETVSGIGISLQMVFGAIAGGMFVRLGPTVGAAFTLLLAEALRLGVGHDIHGLDTTLYGLMLVLFIIFMPKGILGAVQAAWARRTNGGRINGVRATLPGVRPAPPQPEKSS
jgi:branched-chain amino acid transport system permease protein